MASVGTSEDFQIESFLGKKQYDERGVRRYEFIFGDTFVSPGGEKKNGEFLKKLQLKPDQYVLDVGCGIGGCIFQMAREYGVKALGVDISDAMISVGQQYLDEMSSDMKQKIQLKVGDITKIDFEPNTFNAIYSRDSLMHIHDKPTLFKKFHKWLKPGGILCYTDYCSGERKDKNPNYLRYLKERNYVLLTFEEIHAELAKAGFTDVSTDNISQQLIDILTMELDRCYQRKAEFLKRFEESDLDFLAADWNAKKENCIQKDQRWGLVWARKP